MDLVVRNAFHNIKLHPETSAMLSVQTPFGQFEPMFLPEGVAPASGVLMCVMSEVFADFTEWLIVIWDNILVCAMGYADAYEKLVRVINRCRERNVYLKLSKSWFGFSKVEFFGYICEKNSYRLSEKRMGSVVAIPFPSGLNKVKKMQQFLGSAVYFKPFIFDYSRKTAELANMTHRDFSWVETTWVKDYKAAFESFKLDIINSFTLYHPDYNLPWFLYVDASDIALGGVLIQVTVDKVQQIIAFVSKKFNAASARWSTIEKEAYAMFYACQKLQYYLYAKNFVMITDHNNLLWMESSEVPKIVRIRIYLQGFNFELKHVAGKLNVFADWLSRMYDACDVIGNQESVSMCLIAEANQEVFVATDAVTTALNQVHNARMGHHGEKRTWCLLNTHFPGHKISIATVTDFVSSCAYCQKVRSTMVSSLTAPVRSIVAEHPRSLCGYDTLYITPPDAEGFKYIHVFKMIPSRLVALYPSKTLSAESLASAAFQFFVTYGITDVLITDPGANINSEVMKLLLEWFGIRLRMSIVGRHQSNMVERSHREILRFLSTLVNTEGVKMCWSKPHIIAIIQFILNSEKSSETGVSPFEYVFGSVDFPFLKLPGNANEGIRASIYLERLNADLLMVRAAARTIQSEEQQKRMRQPHVLNSYVTGDMILFDEASTGGRDSKLTSRYSGPYVITAIHKADISCSHIVTGKEKVFYMEHVKPFFGTREDAYKVALTDDDQYVIKEIKTYRGDPSRRSLMSFLVLFDDGDEVWVNYKPDLVSSLPFEEFCRKTAELEPLLHTDREWRGIQSRLNAAGVVGIVPGNTCYVDLRAWGTDYFSSIGLPGDATYVVKCDYLKWTSSKRLKVDLRCTLFNQVFVWDATAVRLYGLQLDLPADCVLIDTAWCDRYPAILT